MAGSTYVSASLDVSYENALSARNQLALGTLNLADTAVAVDAEQAAILLPLWQAVRATNQTGGASQTEVNALLESDRRHVERRSTLGHSRTATHPDQHAGLGTGQRHHARLRQRRNGLRPGLSPEARATRQAEQGRTATGSCPAARRRR